MINSKKIKNIAKGCWTMCLVVFWLLRFCFAIILGSIVFLGVPFLVIIGLTLGYMQYSYNIPIWYKILALVITMVVFRLCYKPGCWIVNLIMGDKITECPLDDYFIDHLD